MLSPYRKDLQADGGKKASIGLDVTKIVPHKQNTDQCFICFRKDRLQAEAESEKKQNRKDSDPPGELSYRWAMHIQ